jgi:hypothetical protein
MKVRSSIPKSVLAAIAALTVAAPVAGAVPMYDGHPPQRETGEAYDVNRETGAYTPAGASVDMHASTVTPPALDEEIVASDLRTEAAKSPLESRAGGDVVAGADLRTEAAKEPKLPPGLPVFPSPLEPSAPAAPQPVAATDGDGGSFDWPLAGLIAGGAIALLGAALIAGRQARGHTRPAH